MNIVFATSGLEFNGQSLDQPGGLGGSETAMVYMARELAKLGNRVAVYCRCPKPGQYDGVHYVDVENFVAMNVNLPIDVLIVSRFGMLFSPLVDGALNVFWMHDMPGNRESIMPATVKSDMMFTLSEYHKNEFLKMDKNLSRIMQRTANGVDLELINQIAPQQASKKYKHRFLYSSLPERGLQILLRDIWPRITEKLPDSQLLVCGYNIDSVRQAITGDVLSLREQCNELIATNPDIKHLGGLAKPMLYSVMKSCDAMLYPCTFPEIFCITGVEAQACGLPVITTNGFALPETVGPDNGALVDMGDGYMERFADAAVRVVSDPGTKSRVAVTGPKWVREKGFEWSTIAAQWNSKFNAFLDNRFRDNSSRIVSAAVRRRDIALAESIEERAVKPGATQYLLTTKDADKVPVKVLTDVDLEVLTDLTTGMIRRGRTDFAKGLSVLEFHSGSREPFSCAVAAKMPGSRFFVVCDSFEAPHTWSHLPNVQVLRNSDLMVQNAQGTKYDCVILGNALANAQYPHDKFRVLVKELATPETLFVSITPCGSIAMDPEQAKLQRWSFDLDDLQTLFGGFKEFGAAFAPLYVSQRGDRLGYWLAFFSGDQNVGKINLQTKGRRLRPEQVLTACIISKNEEKWVNMCLSELEGMVDQFVVGDCHSTDRTRDILKMYPNVEVVDVEFEDFAQARNVTLDRAMGDWILVIDCDERLVGAEKLRKFLHHPMAECYVIKQRHLTLDASEAFDTPVRLFRNKPDYRYVGCIHEHVTNCSGGRIDGDMGPTYEIDAEIAHYGYVIESLRKKKVIMRNLDLLIKDAKVNLPKGRLVIWLLAIRDYMNAVKWSMRSANDFSLTPGSFEHHLIESVIRTYHAKFRAADEKYHSKIFPIYQEAVSFLGMAKVPFSDTKTVPFQVALSIYADHEKIKDQTLQQIQPNLLWFLHPAEVREFMDRQSEELRERMFVGYNKDSREVTWDYKPGCPDPAEVLTQIRDRYKRAA
jgi:glycosyltransferase involved in cell wall biosynthesis